MEAVAGAIPADISAVDDQWVVVAGTRAAGFGAVARKDIQAGGGILSARSADLWIALLLFTAFDLWRSNTLPLLWV